MALQHCTEIAITIFPVHHWYLKLFGRMTTAFTPFSIFQTFMIFPDFSNGQIIHVICGQSQMAPGSILRLHLMANPT